MIDIGANLSRYDDNELKKMLTRADHVGIERIFITGTSLESTYGAKRIAESHVELYFTAGCHPHNAKRWQIIDVETMDMFFRHPKCLFVGETGLDYCRMLSTKEEQRYAFQKQIELAIQYQLPLFLHERHAHEDFLNLLDQYKGQLPDVVVHCFTGDKSEVFEYVNRNFYIGITGWLCDDKRSHVLQEAMPYIPDDKLLVETDTPYLAPKGDWLKHLPIPLDVSNGKTQNEPFALLSVIHACAYFRNQSFEHVRKITTANANHFVEYRKNLKIPEMVFAFTPLR